MRAKGIEQHLLSRLAGPRPSRSDVPMEPVRIERGTRSEPAPSQIRPIQAEVAKAFP